MGARSVLTACEAIARVEASIAPGGCQRDPALAEGLALAGVPAASLGRVGGLAEGESLRVGASCVHHVVGAHGCGRGGAFELVASSAQEAIAHCVAAHALSLRLGRPGVCCLSPELADDLALVELPTPGQIAERLAHATRGAPEPGAVPERILELAGEVLRAASDADTTTSGVIERRGAEGARVLLVATGSEAPAACEAARVLSTADVPAAALRVVLTRPFPDAALREALAGAHAVLVVHAPGEPSALPAAVRAAAEGKAQVRLLPATSAAGMLRAISEALPDLALEPPRLAAVAPEPARRRLVVAPDGPWGEETARLALAALAATQPLRLDRRTRSELGATVVGFGTQADSEASGDVLLASHPALLESEGALALLRPGSDVVVLAEAHAWPELARQLEPAVRERLAAQGHRLRWKPSPPAGAGQAGDRAASFALAGAAVAVAAPEVGAERLEAVALGSEDEARWLREGAQALRAPGPGEALDAPLLEEHDFGSAPRHPRLPEVQEDPKAHEVVVRAIRRFHRTGAEAGGSAPRLPLRPALLDGLAETLRRESPLPFALWTGPDAERPIAARGLRALLREQLAALADEGRGHDVLAAQVGRLASLAARPPAADEPSVRLDARLEAAGETLLGELSLPEEAAHAARETLTELRRRLPEDARLLGWGADTPLRLYTAVMQAVRTPLLRRFATRLAELRERLRDLLELDRLHSPEGRAPERLAAALGDAGGSHAPLDAEALSRTLPPSAGASPLEPGRRARLEQCLAAIERHLAEPEAAPRIVLLRPPGLELDVPGTDVREHPDPLGAAVGYFDGAARRMAPLFRAVRTARLEVDGRYRPELHDAALAELDWEGFGAEELALVPPVAVATTGRRLRQRGQGSLSALLCSSRPVHVIVQDEVGASDEAADLSGFHVDLGYLVMAHREAFSLGSTLARPERLADGLVRMARAPRPGVLLVRLPAAELAPWHALLSEAALRGRACPDFLYDPDAGPSWAERFTLEGNPAPERAWPTGRLTYLDGDAEQSLELAFTFADAGALGPAYRRHLRVIPRVAWDDEQIPLAEWLERFAPEGGTPAVPYLWVVDAAGVMQRAVVTRELALACRDRLRAWHVLQELAGYENVHAERAAAAARAQALAQAAEEREALEQAHATALAAARGEGARESMARLAAVLLRPDATAAASLAAPAAAPAAPLAAPGAVPSEAAPGAAAEPEPEEEEEELSFDEPYVDSALCTTCNECTNLNGRLFQYNADKQAFIADASAGSFAELVKAAELCPARCIHPGKPRSDDTSATPELIQRAARFN